MTCAIGPIHQYVPMNQCRAAYIGNVNTKLRITAVLNRGMYYTEFSDTVCKIYGVENLNR